MSNRPKLEVLSWLATIIGMLFAFYTYSKSPSESASVSQKFLTTKPSFDCPKASNKTERLICSEHDIAILDLTMANAYRDLQAETKNVQKLAEIKLAQNNWLKNIRNSCDETRCLKTAYTHRINTLNNLRR